MKRIALILILWLSCWSVGLQAAEIWVAPCPAGSDQNQGSRSQPLATLNAAMRQARELRRLSDPSIQGGIKILMKGGIYHMTETLLIRSEDSGTPESPTIIEAAPGEKPILSGGVQVQNWESVSTKIEGLPEMAKGKIFAANVPAFEGMSFDFRQVWVNGTKATPASNTDEKNMLRILYVDKSSSQIRIPSPMVKKFSKPSEIEMFIHQMWETAVLRVSSVRIKGDEAILSFRQPEKRLEFEHPWPPPVISERGNSVFRLSRAIEFLDQPGEWYYDRSEGKLFYYPGENEDMKTAEVVIPVLENLVIVQGIPEKPVQQIQWKGITFAHSSWLRPSRQGYVPLQAGMFLLDAYKLQVPGTKDKAALENQAWIGRQPAAVQLSNVRNTVFESCTFSHCGASGLDYQYGSSNDRIEGCLFQDIAGSALVVGKFSDPGIETHLPYIPTDERELCQNMQIRNNLVQDAANEYWGCVGIIAGYVRDVAIEHNELCDLAYSGISVGWGWTRTVNCMKNNIIKYNLVHHFGKHNYSCGGVYTLSAQPGTVIAENCIRDIYKPNYVHDDTGFFIYLDEASSYITIKDNWCSEAKFGTNQNGMTVWENNGPQVSEAIKNNAGLQPEFNELSDTKRTCDK